MFFKWVIANGKSGLVEIIYSLEIEKKFNFHWIGQAASDNYSYFIPSLLSS